MQYATINIFSLLSTIKDVGWLVVLILLTLSAPVLKKNRILNMLLNTKNRYSIIQAYQEIFWSFRNPTPRYILKMPVISL